MKLLLKISYLGTDFCGYQVQKGQRTVQGECNRATASLFGFPTDIVGCSRTDSGVHANAFYCTVTRAGCSSLETSVPTEKIPLALNLLLPSDLAVQDAVWVKEEFHPRYDVIYKEYLYRIRNTGMRDPFSFGRLTAVKRVISEEQIGKMQEAAAYFVGEHDFSAFMAQGSPVSSTVRGSNMPWSAGKERRSVSVWRQTDFFIIWCGLWQEHC